MGLGEFSEVPWHKKENILKAVGVKVEYGEPIERGLDRVTFRTVGDLEHSQIVKLYIEGLSMNKIAGELGRSTIDRSIVVIYYIPKYPFSIYLGNNVLVSNSTTSIDCYRSIEKDKGEFTR